MRILAVLTLALSALSCARTVYEPVESVRTEYRDREVERIVADTVNTTRFVLVKGDTVIDYVEKERTHRVEVHDTCYVEHSDTIRVPYPVERSLSRWEQAKMDFGGMAIGVLTGAVCMAVVWIILRFKRRKS